MNIKIIALCFLVINDSCFVFSREDIESVSDPNSAETVQDAKPTLVKNNVFSLHPYGLSDGTKLWEKEIFPLLQTVPDNAILLRQEKTLRLIMAANQMITGASIMGYFFMNDFELSNKNSMTTALYFAGGVGLFSTIITALAREHIIARAIKNYNLTVMGIPVE